MAAAMTMVAAAVSGCALLTARHDPAQVTSGLYRVDPDHTEVNWSVSHFGFTEFQGRFDTVSGTLRLDPGSGAADQLDIRIETASINTPSHALNTELASVAWFDAASYPAVTFHSTAVAGTGPGTARVTGDLTLHGVTRPLTLDVRFVGAGLNPLSGAYTAGFAATGTLNRADFGIAKLLPAIGDSVTLTLAGAFERS